MPWRLWSMGQPVLVLDSISPQRLSWDRAEHINQQRLRAYLAPIRSKMAPIIASGSKWALSMTVDLERENRLFRGNDVDNYIAPVIKALGWERFVYADVTKRVGGGSHIALAPAVHHSGIPSGNGWSRRIFGRIDTEAGKRAIREGLRQQVDAPLPLGPVAVHLAWRLAVMRNWVNCWKPTVDAMGPVVGEPRIHKREFHPDDDRITTLTLHRLVDDSLNNKTVDVGLWWDRR